MIEPATVRMPGGRASDRATGPGYFNFVLFHLLYVHLTFSVTFSAQDTFFFHFLFDHDQIKLVLSLLDKWHETSALFPSFGQVSSEMLFGGT